MPGKAPSSDPTLKTLVEFAPADWLPLLGLPRCPVTVRDSDLATVVSGAVDKVLHVHADPDYLLHLDFQLGHDSAVLPPRLRLYNTVLDYRHDLPVLSVAVILWPGADSPRINGLYTRTRPGEAEPYLAFRYRVVRVWQLPLESLLSGGLGTLPLAPISDVGERELPGVIQGMQERLKGEEHESRTRDLWTAASVLTGLRYSPEFAKVLFRGVMGMKESSVYQAIVAEGRAEGLALGAIEEARKFLLKVGRKRLGPPDRATRAAVDAIGDVGRLEQLGERLFEVEDWAELLAAPTPRRRNGRR